MANVQTSTSAALPPRSSRRRRPVRAVVSGICGLIVVLLVLMALFIPAPYVVESPGPTINTLGSMDEKKLISVRGHDTFPTTGSLDLVTVYVDGGPQSKVTIFDALGAWLDPTKAVYPQEVIYPPELTRQQVNQENAADMTNSQDAARAAALNFQHIPFEEKLIVAQAVAGGPADGKLKAGDSLVSIDGKKVDSLDVVKSELAATAGKPVAVTVSRDGSEATEQVTPQKGEDGSYLLGILLKYNYKFPVDINFNLDKVGGPSAGMMFTLGIIDTMTPGNLAGDTHVAGTGTIDEKGNVGAIGGIGQKMVGAQRSGATLFLAPAANCSDVVGHIPHGLKVVKVSTLTDAYHAVEAYGKGQDVSKFPSCAAG